MIRLNKKEVVVNHFPDETLLLKEAVEDNTPEEKRSAAITWNFENNEELLVLYFLTRHLQTAGVKNILLNMPYMM